MLELPNQAGAVLTALARQAIGQKLGLPSKRPVQAAWLSQPGASFVTLNLDGQLRGCIGSLSAYRALGKDVAANAVAAGFEDPRFGPVTLDEFQVIKLEVSVLSSAKPLAFTSGSDAIGQLKPGQDGIILSGPGGRRATFLPQVWQQLPEPETFITHLKMKAGLPVDLWDGIELERYSVLAFTEP